jgi:release factor glutamine methyltransferase
VQYVTGTAVFMFAEFEVNPAVLIPRPETEALTEIALRLLGDASESAKRSAEAASSPEVLAADVGTGSGVIAVTLAQKFPDVRVLAIDSSSEALEVASRNAERAGVAARVEFIEGNMLEPLNGHGLEGRISLLVSNPPYVASGDIDTLPREIRDFEPRGALDGGVDGLDCLRVMAQDGPAVLAPGGAMALEVGDEQAEKVAAMLRESLGEVSIEKDYARRDRIVVARKRL